MTKKNCSLLIICVLYGLMSVYGPSTDVHPLKLCLYGLRRQHVSYYGVNAQYAAVNL